MSFLYRPTPIVVLSGKTVGTDHVPLRRSPAGTMHGYAGNMFSPALNMIGRRTLSGKPWLIHSGTMGRFLGQDDGTDDLSSDFFSGLSESPTLPTDSLGLPTDFFSGATVSPLAPTSTISVAAPSPAAPTFATPVYNPGTAVPVASSGGSTGVAAAAASAPSLLQQIVGLVTGKSSVTPMTAAQPGVYSATTVTPSWFNQSTLLPGISNSAALFGGAAVIVLFAVVAKRR